MESPIFWFAELLKIALLGGIALAGTMQLGRQIA
jgi:hypothetical protein